MASALGKSLPPDGATGTVTKIAHMPDQIPDNPASIVANTSIETLQNILFENWIWRNTFQIDTSMKPGHIFGLIPIHPRECNEYITHLSQMFLTWTGSMKIRTRFMATFQFGGSFRIGFLPPKFNRAEVLRVGIQTLTAYPNVDLDPKNTDWSQFQCSDERNVLFHWMNGDYDKAESFAGWFVFYVAAPLVVSGTDSSVSLLCEAAGGFNFSQLAPLNQVIAGSNAWFQSQSALYYQSGCDDYAQTFKVNIWPTTIRSLPCGFFYASTIGGSQSDYPPSIYGGSFTAPFVAYRNAKRMANYGGYVNDSDWPDSVPLLSAPLNLPKAGIMWTVTAEGVQGMVKSNQKYVDASHDDWYKRVYRDTNAIHNPGYFTTWVAWTTGSEVHDISEYEFEGADGGAKLDNPLTGESLVTFSSYAPVGINVQTGLMRSEFEKLPDRKSVV